MRESEQISQVDAVSMSIQKAQREAEIINQAKRQAERNEKTEAWQDPDAIKYREILTKKKAFESIQMMKATGNYNIDQDIPLPPDSELPKELRGQQPSTIRAELRGNKAWEEKVKAHRAELVKKDERGQYLRKRYPDMFGIDCSEARRLWKAEEAPKEEKKPAFSVTEKAAPDSKSEIKKEDNVVAKIFAGIFGK